MFAVVLDFSAECGEGHAFDAISDGKPMANDSRSRILRTVTEDVLFAIFQHM